MKKLIAKLLLPKPADLAKTIAKAAADFVNSSGKEEAIASYVEKSQPVQDAQFLLAKWLADGKVDEAEEAELADKLEPIIKALYDKALGG